MPKSLSPAWAWRWLLILGFAAIGAINLPGQVPFDTVTALWEGRTHVRMSWGPRMFSAILGLFDAVLPGTGLFAAASLFLLFLAWWALARLPGRVGWIAPALLAFWLLAPDLLIYQGILWRDVLFANLVVAGFVALAFAFRLWERAWPRAGLLALAALCLALAALVRQNGGVVIGPAALALAWTARAGGWRRALAWFAGGLAAPVALALALAVVDPVHEPPGGRTHSVGFQILAHYDLVAALAEDPARPLPRLAADHPYALKAVRREAPGVYSPTRVDTIDQARFMNYALWRFDRGVMMAAWRDLIGTDPGGYLRRRLEIFRWVFLTPDLKACVPLHLGISGLPEVEQALGLRDGPTLASARLYAYAQAWFATPAYSHLTYAILALAVMVFLLLRRRPADLAIAALMLGVLGFTATFFVLSIACDYRYLYALDLAAITGTLYLAMDPSRRRA